MLFNSTNFLVFFAIFILLYFNAKGRLRLLILLVASLFFYSCYSVYSTILLLALIIYNYIIGIFVQKNKICLIFAIFVNLVILAVFKYTNFILRTSESLFSTIMNSNIEFITLDIILPIGISFYIFEMISYVIDIYQGKLAAEKNLLHFSLYISFFPRLVAGPILKPSSFLSQIEQALLTNPSWNTIINGLQMVIWGFFKKIVVADSVAYYVNLTFKDPTAYTSLGLVISIMFYSFQIYCDFSGYSDIAIGLGKITGFDLGINFNRPYFSKSFSEFWQRWHISLSTWLKDYVYIPLGGNRISVHRTYQNLMITMLLGGLWHGANWNFIIWGGLHGLYLVLQRLVTPFYHKFIDFLKIPSCISNIFITIVIFVLTAIAWIFFRTQTIQEAFNIIDTIFKNGNWNFTSLIYKFQVIKGLLVCSIILIVELFSLKINFHKVFQQYPVLHILVGCSVIYSISLLGTFQGQTFIYLNF